MVKRWVFFESVSRSIIWFWQDSASGLNGKIGLSVVLCSPACSRYECDALRDIIAIHFKFIVSETQICCHANFSYGNHCNTTEYKSLYNNIYPQHLYQTDWSEIDKNNAVDLFNWLEIYENLFVRLVLPTWQQWAP
jgi:hypothetical protein